MSIELPQHHYLDTGQILLKVVLPCVYLFPMPNGYFAYFQPGHKAQSLSINFAIITFDFCYF